MAYNGDGLRDSRTTGGNTATFTWDPSAGSGQAALGVPQVLDDSSLKYVYGVGRISQVDPGGAFYYLSDGLGSTMALTDASGAVVNTYNYDVFGGIRSQTGASPNYWLFTGEQRDSDSSFYYLRARYYDPTIGRFVGRDPIPGSVLDPLSLSPYLYARDNPINYIDPEGLFFHKKLKKFFAELTEGVGKPLVGAALIIVADLPLFIGEPLCLLTVWTGVTCVVVQVYGIFVATPATYIGLCLIEGSNFFGIPGLDRICRPTRTASATSGTDVGLGKE